MAILRLTIEKYLPEKLYGFAVNEQGHRVFFPTGNFYPGARNVTLGCGNCKAANCPIAESAMPPIIGEAVDVELPEGTELSNDQGKVPRAIKVTRVHPVRPVVGLVEGFDFNKGYGYIKGNDGISYHLHRCEVQEGIIPLAGMALAFLAGTRQGKPRACHARICRWQH